MSKSILLDSDSSSDDDSILGDTAGLLKKKRSARKSAEDKKKAHARALLDEGLDYGEKKRLDQQRHQQIKMEESSKSSKHNVLVKAESIMAAANQTSLAAKRRQTNDAILGLTTGSSSIANAALLDGGTAPNNNHNNPMMDDLQQESEEHLHDEEYHKRRKAQAHATITGRTTLLGVRSTLLLGGSSPSQQQQELSFPLYSTNPTQDALQELKDILQNITSSRRKDWTMAIVKPIKTALDNDCFHEFLDMCLLVKHCEKHNVTTIPTVLMIWLYKVACSCTSTTTTHKTNHKRKSTTSQRLSPTFQQCAFETLLALWDNGITGDDSHTQKSFLILEEMVPQLEQWYGLQPLSVLDRTSDDKENATTNNTNNDNDDDDNNEESESLKPNLYSAKNDFIGLKHYLHLWSLAILKGYYQVVLPRSNTRRTATSKKEQDDDDKLNLNQIATNCLVALSRAGIDVTFQSGRFLLKPLCSLLDSILYMVSNILNNKDENSSCWNEWMTSTVQEILKQRYHLGSGVEGSENEDDDEAWLSMSLMVRLFYRGDGTAIHKPFLEFRTSMALESIKQCLDIPMSPSSSPLDKDTDNDTDDSWDRHAKSVLQDSGNESLMKLYNERQPTTETFGAWKAITSAYVGLFSIELVGDKVATDGPRCMATVESVALCAQAGMNLVSIMNEKKHTNNKNDNLKQEQNEGETSTTPPPKPSTILATSATAANGGIYQNVQNADTMCHILDLLEHQVKQVIKRIKQYQIQPHFQRCMYYLSCLQTFYRYCKEDASRMAGQRQTLTTMMGGSGEKGGRQTSMNNFFGSISSAHDGDDDDGDHDDEDDMA